MGMSAHLFITGRSTQTAYLISVDLVNVYGIKVDIFVIIDDVSKMITLTGNCVGGDF